jgi:membrane-associated phospholipid phosphatase
VIRTVSGHDSTALSGSGPRDRSATTEMMVGGSLVALVALGGLYFAFRPSPVVMDGWFSFLVSDAKGTWFTDVTVLRYPMVIVVGAIIAAAVTYRRDPPRAWACLIGPILALATCELVLKPLVGRTLGGVFSYPSGSTTGAAGLAAAAVLATPARWRVVTTVVASIYALWVALAVVALQWHLPTDAAAGLAYGVGVVLVVDGSAWKLAVLLRPRFHRHRPQRDIRAVVGDRTADDGDGA